MRQFVLPIAEDAAYANLGDTSPHTRVLTLNVEGTPADMHRRGAAPSRFLIPVERPALSEEYAQDLVGIAVELTGSLARVAGFPEDEIKAMEPFVSAVVGIGLSIFATCLGARYWLPRVAKVLHPLLIVSRSESSQLGGLSKYSGLGPPPPRRRPRRKADTFLVTIFSGRTTLPGFLGIVPNDFQVAESLFPGAA